jgi:hypothetical protein
MTEDNEYIYIETAEDKRKYAPKLATDEFRSELRNGWRAVFDDGAFASGVRYRRRKPAPERYKGKTAQEWFWEAQERSRILGDIMDERDDLWRKLQEADRVHAEIRACFGDETAGMTIVAAIKELQQRHRPNAAKPSCA